MNNIDTLYRQGILLAATRQQMSEAKTDSQRHAAARALRSIVKAH